MLGLKIFVQLQTFQRRPFLPLHNFCHLLKKCLLNFPVKILLCNSSALRIKVKHYTSANFCRNICNFFLCLLLLSHHCIGTYVGIRSWHKSLSGSHVGIRCAFFSWISRFCCEAFLKIGILHLPMLFWVGFPNSVIGYFPKLVTHIFHGPFWWISALFSIL